jgi:hypothetical protein
LVCGSSIMVTLSCLVLVFHPEYEDGLIMRVGLVAIVFASVARVARLFDGTPDYLSPVAITLWTGLALFLCMHTYRFLKRATWKGSTWYPHTSGKAFNFFRRRVPPG